MRLYYAGAPSTLSSDSDKTDVPVEYIRREGLAYLWEHLAAQLGGDDRTYATRQADKYHAKAVLYKRQHGYRLDWSRIQEEAGSGSYTDADNPLDW